MACSTKTMRVTRSVWSDGTTTAIYHSFQRLPISDWAKARVSILMEGSSGSLTVTSAAVYGDEEVDFAAGTVVDLPTTPTTVTADGAVWGASYATLDASRQQIDVGLKVKNTAGTKIEQARVTLVIEVSE